MTPGKRLTIGVTVNLERYENLRVAVEGGDVDTLEDAEMLARYLDDVLAGGFGKNDQETEKQIANYRFRVLPGRGDAADDAAHSEQEQSDAEPDVQGNVQSAAQTNGVTESGVFAQAETSIHCADCGALISKQEDKLGHIFMDRPPLCKHCLDAIQKAQH
ncbi:hypothetical protein [Methanogenium cariaci]|uniref:hypothetical protein n=1 Tax=Methanogenium cariaci TaxID=2197 RepID=UPI0012F66D6C|nr:hypothetical protein [Methanogenium cariaci]